MTPGPDRVAVTNERLKQVAAILLQLSEMPGLPDRSRQLVGEMLELLQGGASVDSETLSLLEESLAVLRASVRLRQPGLGPRELASIARDVGDPDRAAQFEAVAKAIDMARPARGMAVGAVKERLRSKDGLAGTMRDLVRRPEPRSLLLDLLDGVAKKRRDAVHLNPDGNDGGEA